MSNHHALIFGASGISGWAIVNALLSGYPEPDSFSRITALTNRPLKPEVAQWPQSDKLQVVSGLDLLADGGQTAVEEQMKLKVIGIETVSHVYFFAYVFNSDASQEISTNVELLRRAITAVESLSKSLEFVVLPTGTKAYGVHLPPQNVPFPFQPPLSESLPRIPEPYASEMFYYNQVDLLASLSTSKRWSWCEVRPDVIVGFVPNNNVYCLAQTLALYLSLYASVEGSDAMCPFPGTEKSWGILSNDSSQDMVAKFSIYASLHPNKTAGSAFNVAANSNPTSWSQKWPIICEFFGLQGTPPPPEGSGPQPMAYLDEHLSKWKELENACGLQTGRVGNDRSLRGYDYFIMTMFDFDRQLDLKKSQETWGEETDIKGTWWTAFDRFRKAKIIP